MAQLFIEPEFRVTETQHLIATTALSVLSNGGPVDEDLINYFVRTMVIIQKGGFESYFANGLDWSFRSRALQEPEQVGGEIAALQNAVTNFNQGIDTARGKAACRIRGNRARRVREYQRELDEMIEEQQDNLVALQEHRAGVRRMGHHFDPDLAA